MTWFKVDDSLHSHKKAMRAGAEAMGLWVLAGSWSADQLTDGWVPDYMARRWAGNSDELAERLVRAGLWIPDEYDGDPGWWFHDWAERQPSREDVLARRKADAERRARWREARRKAATPSEPSSVSHGESRRDTARESQVGSVLPDPTRPDPVSSNEETLFGGETKTTGRKRPATKLPHEWKPNEKHQEYAKEHGLDVGREAFKFRNHAEANDRRQANWNASFTQWLAHAAEWSKPKQATGSEDWRRFSEQ